jgi:hypothetical protein
VKGHSARIRQAENSLLCFVASCAGIDQVRIFEFPGRVRGNWYEVIDVKGRAAVIPLLTVKAIYTPKEELIPEPIPITAIVRITRRTVPPRVRRGGILESSHLDGSVFHWRFLE